ncbi:MAG: 6-carboxytetrahydropterin synthase [bacterium]
MKYNLLVKGVFSAAHRLMGSGGKCENMHGHNFRVELMVGGNNLGDTGMLIDFADLKETLARILKDLDHSDLNTLEPFREKSPSSESIAEYIFVRAELDLAGFDVKVLSITVAESDTVSATYISQKAGPA